MSKANNPNSTYRVKKEHEGNELEELKACLRSYPQIKYKDGYYKMETPAEALERCKQYDREHKPHE